MKTIDTKQEIKVGDFIFAPDQDGKLVLGKVITLPPKLKSKKFLAKLEDDPKLKPTEEDLIDDPNHTHIDIETHRGHLVPVKGKFAFSTEIPNANENE